MTDRSLVLGKYSIGTGDRFAHQAKAQLRASMLALEAGIEVQPAWNKSNREHSIIGSEPGSVRRAADAAVRELGWDRPYFVDADHIGAKTVDRFLDACDFYTIDVADFIGQKAEQSAIDAFIADYKSLLGPIRLEGAEDSFTITESDLRQTAAKFLTAVKTAGVVYRQIELAKGMGNFIAEVSMD